MKHKMKNLWWVYINGYRIVETRSIGYKWVYYRCRYFGNYKSRYTRIKRSVWDKACISTLVEHQAKYKLAS